MKAASSGHYRPRCCGQAQQEYDDCVSFICGSEDWPFRPQRHFILVQVGQSQKQDLWFAIQSSKIIKATPPNQARTPYPLPSHIRKKKLLKPHEKRLLKRLEQEVKYVNRETQTHPPHNT
jgi:hypothetical protein